MGDKHSDRSIAPIGLIALGVLLLVGAIAWYIYTLTTQPAVVPGAAIPPQNPEGEISRVSLTDAKAAFDRGSAVFLDVRDAEAYARSHVSGAILIPLNELQERIKELDPTAWIITYCT